MNPYIFSSFTTATVALGVGLFVFLRDKTVRLNKIFFFYSLSISIWAFLTACHMMTSSSMASLACAKIMHVAVILIPVFFLYFVFILLGLDEDRKIIVLLKCLFGLAALCAILSITTNWIVAGVRPKLGCVNFMDAGILYFILICIFSATAILGLLFLFEAFFRQGSSSTEKKKYAYLFWSSLIGYAMGASNFFPVYDKTWFPYPYGCLGVTFYLVIVTYVTFKYGFFSLGDLAQAAHRDKLTAIGVLAASINHEVKNPLFIIKGLAESQLERQKEGVFKSDREIIEKGNDAFQRSMDQADRAMDIIKRLSLFAKAGIDSEIKFESVSINEIIENILPLVRYELATHSIALTREIPKVLPDVQADRRYLEEIFFNLIVNACQALRERPEGGEIVIRATAPSPVLSQGERDGVRGSFDAAQDDSFGKKTPKGQVIVTIQDNGPGIPTDKLAHVFRPFYTTKEEGTGLGLYITQQLVEKIKGRISVQSEIGKGTVFIVALPF